MFFDNIILFLNVLEQFAIRVTIFDFNIGDIIKYVNNSFFLTDGKDFFDSSLSQGGLINECKNPNVIVRNQLSLIDQKLDNTNLIFKKLNYDHHSSSFNYIYG
jgi:hypothetical protein